VRGSRGAVDVLGGGSGVVGVAVRRVLSVGDRSAAHIEGGREGKIAGGKGVFWWASWCVSLCEGVRSAVQGPTDRFVLGLAGSGLGDTGRVVFRLGEWMVVVLQRGCASCLMLSLSPEWDFFEGFWTPLLALHY
jgi:hypothetical protein